MSIVDRDAVSDLNIESLADLSGFPSATGVALTALLSDQSMRKWGGSILFNDCIIARLS